MSPNRSCGNERVETLQLPEMLSTQPGPGTLRDHPLPVSLGLLPVQF